MGRYGLLVVLSLGTAFAYACGDDDDDSMIGDGGLDGGEAGMGGARAGNGSSGTGGNAGSGGAVSGSGGSSVSGSGGSGNAGSAGSNTAGTTAPPVECGNDTCDPPDGNAADMGVSACCTDDDTCGLMNPLTGMCLEMGITGGADVSCPIFTLGGALTLSGCCTPEGECGAQFGDGAGGCISNGQLMTTEQSCTPDPNNTCDRIVDVACDGNEDCDNGQQCCGVYQGGYRSFQCADSCADGQADQAGSTWSEACHPGEECTDPATSCRQNLTFLPDFLFRCRIDGETPERTDGSTAAGEVNCGDYVCGQGQKCCLSVPGQAVCVDENSTCGCTPEGELEDGGVEDAGH